MPFRGIGSSSKPVGGAAPASGPKASGIGGPKSAEEELLDYARMSPAERMRSAILQEMGLTEEVLAKMGPEERAQANDEIAERIRDKAIEARERHTGMIVDVSA
jgi:hypothetical protein